MSELIWCEVGPSETSRFKILSEFLKSESIPNQFTFIKSENENLKEKIREAQNLKAFIRFHPDIYDKVYDNIANSRRDLDVLKSIDSLMYDSKLGYWPENFLKDSIFEFLTTKIKNLDVSQKTFIVGTAGMARSVISALIRLGFSKINVTSEIDEDSQNLIKDFNDIFYNVNFEYTKRNDVTILPGANGLVVSTISMLEKESFPTEIYYFNFLKKGGLVVDLVDVPPETPFTKIASDIGAQTFPGYEVLAHFDLHWVEKVTGQRLDLERYLKVLKPYLEQASYDKNKVQKILEEFQI